MQRNFNNFYRIWDKSLQLSPSIYQIVIHIWFAATDITGKGLRVGLWDGPGVVKVESLQSWILPIRPAKPGIYISREHLRRERVKYRISTTVVCKMSKKKGANNGVFNAPLTVPQQSHVDSGNVIFLSATHLHPHANLRHTDLNIRTIGYCSSFRNSLF